MRSTPNIRLNVFAGLGLFAILLGGWVLNKSFENVREQEQWVRHTHEVISELDKLYTSVKEIEAQLRGFLITKDEKFLTTYEQNVVDVWQHYDRITGMVRDNPAQVMKAGELRETLQKRLEQLGHFAAPSEPRPKANANDEQVQNGSLTMQILTSEIESMKFEEKRLFDARAEESKRSEFSFYGFLIASTLLSLSIVSIAFMQSRRNQLRQAAEAEASSREAWRKTHIGEITRLVTGDLTPENASRGVLDFLARSFEIPSLNLYLLEGGSLRLAASHGGNAPARIETGQGLVGEAFRQKEIRVIENLPNHYFWISSSTGESAPTTVTLAPITFQNANIGILELASFKALSEEQKNLLREMLDAAAVGINATQSRLHLQQLLEKTQQQAEELQAQQEELRTNNEELEEQARSLENQQQALNLRNRELESARIENEQKAADLEKASRYKSDFLAKMSHELRTPLNSLLILATLLLENRENNLTDKQKEFTRSIQSAGNDLLSLINDILDLSKIEAQKLLLRPESLRLPALLRQKETTFQPQAQAKGLAFKVEVAPELENIEIITDRQRLEQILRNLISNALKFTEKGTVTVRAYPVADASRFCISVIDTGVGIAGDKRDLIFEAFEQADSSISRKYGGTGLGLTISRELAGLLGGFIRVESAEGKGSEFMLNLPRVLKTDQDNLVAPPEKSVSTRSSLLKESRSEATASKDEVVKLAKAAVQGIGPNEKTILIVEDDEIFRKSVAEAAKSFAFTPIEAADGEVALSILDRHMPSAILLDIKLPSISGLGLLEMIKQSPQFRHLPIHMISALEYQQNALRMGAMGYLAKPVTVDKVKSALSRIENLISKKVKNVLIVEDDDRQREAIRHLIEGSDLEIQTAASGRETLEAIQKQGFDCIILDLNLPDISGFDLLDQMRGLEVSLPPIVIYTGKDLSREETDRLRRYSESIILKGAKSPERLLDEVNLFLHRVEALLPEEKKEMLQHLRQKDALFDGKTVLLVDDDLRNVFALTHALEERGFKVQVARDGQEAVEWMDTHDDIDVVLMDIMMPRMDGFEATRRIRGMPQHKNLPIIALTAKAMREDHEKCIEAGANDYLPKPINLANLSSVLKVWLSPKNAFVQ